jgi:hypothetical protein
MIGSGGATVSHGFTTSPRQHAEYIGYQVLDGVKRQRIAAWVMTVIATTNVVIHAILWSVGTERPAEIIFIITTIAFVAGATVTFMLDDPKALIVAGLVLGLGPVVRGTVLGLNPTVLAMASIPWLFSGFLYVALWIDISRFAEKYLG